MHLRRNIALLLAVILLISVFPTAYAADAPVTRAAALAQLVDEFNIGLSQNGTQFDDVSAGANYYDAVMSAKALGIVSGVGNNKFMPEAAITRQDMFVMLYNALSYSGRLPDAQITVWTEFDDWNNVSDYASKPVQRLSLLLKLEGSFRPKDSLTPDEAAELIRKIVTLLPPLTEIVIYHTNDQHGRVIGDDRSVIGIDRIAAIHKSTENSILVDAGDTLHGLPAATLNKGADIITLMNAAGYDAMTTGNHDFNYGLDRLRELRDMADFPIFTSNVTMDSSPLLDDTRIIEVGGVKVGLFGLMVEEAHIMPEYVKGLTFENAAEVAQSKVLKLKSEGAQVIIAICHLGDVPGYGTMSSELAEAVPDIDVIIDGHSHTTLPEGTLHNGVLIAQTGEYENSLGKVVIRIKDGAVKSMTAALISFEEASAVTPDADTAAALKDITAALQLVLQEPVGSSAVEMSSARAPGVRTQEMPLGNLVADAYRAAAGADIAIANGGDIRADIKPGIITKGDIISILPFGNTLMVKNVTPAQLCAALDNGVSGAVVGADGNIDHEKSMQGRFPQISGFSFTYNPAAPVGSRILSITLDDGTVLSLEDDKTQLSLAGSNYILTGGDDYAMLAELPVERELGAADEALAEYVSANSPLTAIETGRIIPIVDELADAA